MANSADPVQKPTDVDLRCLQRQGIYGFSRTRVTANIPYHFLALTFIKDYVQGKKVTTGQRKVYLSQWTAKPTISPVWQAKTRISLCSKGSRSSIFRKPTGCRRHMRSVKTLIRLCECAGWSSMVARLIVGLPSTDSYSIFWSFDVDKCYKHVLVNLGQLIQAGNLRFFKYVFLIHNIKWHIRRGSSYTMYATWYYVLIFRSRRLLKHPHVTLNTWNRL